MMTTGISLSQLSTVNPDTVCYQSTALSTYTIPSVGSGTYTWTVATNANVTGQSNQAVGQTTISQTLTNLTNNSVILLFIFFLLY